MNFGAMFNADKANKKMIRKHFRITRRQDMLIKRIAKMRGVSEAEIIRQAIERETSQEPPVSEMSEAKTTPAELGVTDLLERALEEPAP